MNIETPKVYLEMTKLKPEGKPPCPRYQHSAVFFKKYLMIYGGRNDLLFKSLQNSALNDLHLYDIEENKWAVIALYGFHPMSRWG
jgi:hypothetical protein